MTKQANTLPKGWAETCIGELANYINGRGFKKSEWKKAGIPIIRIQNLNDPACEFNYSDATHEDRYLVQNDELLMSWAASLGVYWWRRGDAWLNQHIFKVVPHSIADKKFLFYALQSVLAELYKKTHGSGMVHIKKGKFESHPLKLPPFNEQKRIVDKIEQLFSDIDKGEENLRTAQRLLSSYRQAVLKAAVTGELTRDWREANKTKLESGEALLKRILKTRREQWQGRGKYAEPKTIRGNAYFDIPNTWALTTLDMISNRITDGTHQSPKFEPKGIPFVVIGNVKNGKIDWNSISKWVSADTYEESTRRCRPEKGDILYTAVGSYGIALPITDKRQFMFQRHIAHIKPIDGLFDLDFLVYVLSSPQTLGHAHKVARGVAQKTVTLGELSLFNIPLPPREEQKEIANIVTDKLSQITALEVWCETELKRSATLRQSILKSAFSGNLVPQDAADEPASKLLKHIQEDNAATISKPKSNSKGIKSKRKAA